MLETDEIDTKITPFNYQLFYKYLNLENARIHRFEQTDLKITSTRPVLKVEYTSCPECGFPLEGFDEHRNETVCGHCGYVTAIQYSLELDKNINGRSLEALPKNDGLLRHDEKLIIAKLRKKRYYTEMKDWRKKQYYNFAEKVIEHYKMRRGLDFLLLTIINKYKLKELHSKCAFEKIILGVAIEILRRSRRLIPFSDNFVQMVGLEKDEQKVIRENLQSLQVFK